MTKKKSPQSAKQSSSPKVTMAQNGYANLTKTELNGGVRVFVNPEQVTFLEDLPADAMAADPSKPQGTIIHLAGQSMYPLHVKEPLEYVLKALQAAFDS